MVVESTQLPLKVHNRIDQQKEKCCQNVNEHMTGRRGCPRANERAQAGELTKVSQFENDAQEQMKVLKSRIYCDYKRVEKSTQVQIIEQESKTAMHTSQNNTRENNARVHKK